MKDLEKTHRGRVIPVLTNKLLVFLYIFHILLTPWKNLRFFIHENNFALLTRCLIELLTYVIMASAGKYNKNGMVERRWERKTASMIRRCPFDP